MATRVVEGKKPYTGGKAISIDENKVISLNLRDENNLIIYDEGDDEIYVDLQLDDEITPTDAFPIGVNVGRVIVDNGWDKPGTIISAVTTSGDNIKIFYADDGTLWIDNGTGTFKQIYFKADVDALLLALRNYIDGELAKKQNGVVGATAPESPAQGDLWYDTTTHTMKVWDGTAWQSVGGSDIEYVTQAEYNALLPGALTDNKHYFIYSTSGGGGWQPGVNTIAYYPFKGDVENKVDGTLATLGSGSSIGSNYATLNRSIITCPLSENFGVSGTAFTYSVWANPYQYPTDNPRIINYSNTPFYLIIKGNTSKVIINWFPDENANYTGPINGIGTWNNIIIAYPGSGTDVYVYINGVKYTYPNGFENRSSYNNLILGDSSSSDTAYFYISEMILETKQRTDQEAQDYFDQTKGNYGIS